MHPHSGRRADRNRIMRVFRTGVAIVLAGATVFGAATSISQAQEWGKPVSETVVGQRYVPGIWIDPDGCEHWAMDDGVEGYMTPNVDRNGIPVCHRSKACAVMRGDQLFHTDSHKISHKGKKMLMQFFQSAGASAYIIEGHTDSDASDSYNMALSQRRASAVAGIASRAGARVASVRWYGERLPVASNATAGGKAKNRRVEIHCIR